MEHNMEYEIPITELRMVREKTIKVPSIRVDDEQSAFVLAHSMIGDSAVERLIGIMLDGRARIQSVVPLAQGGSHGLSISAKDVIRAVLISNASGFVLAHNHPSGDSTASREDLIFTEAIIKVAEVCGVPLMDHIIVTQEGLCGSAMPSRNT